MPRIDLNAETLPEFERRVVALAPDAARRWGTMSVARMFAHLRIIFEISLEDRPAKDESRPWLMPILWVLMFEWWTNWHTGIVKASPQFIDDSAEDAERERQALLQLMRRFVARAEQEPNHLVLEPMLGRVSLAKWRRIHGIHTDYHLRQFGAM